MNDHSEDVARLLGRVRLIRAVVDAAVRFVEAQEPNIAAVTNDKKEQARLREVMNAFTRALSDIGIVRLHAPGAPVPAAEMDDVRQLETRIRQLTQAMRAGELVMNMGVQYVRAYKTREAQEVAYAAHKQFKAARSALYSVMNQKM